MAINTVYTQGLSRTSCVSDAYMWVQHYFLFLGAHCVYLFLSVEEMHSTKELSVTPIGPRPLINDTGFVFSLGLPVVPWSEIGCSGEAL